MENGNQLLAVISEESCIGCTKCAKICPLNAIVGASKMIHTVIADSCTGCNLCVSVCPTQCIKLKKKIDTSKNKL